MTNTPPEFRRFQIIPLRCDDLGKEIIDRNAVAYGSMSDIAEHTRNDSMRVRADSIAEISSLRSKIANLEQKLKDARADAATAKADLSKVKSDLDRLRTGSLMNKAVEQLNGLISRMDTLEEREEREQLRELEEVGHPPGYEPKDDPVDRSKKDATIEERLATMEKEMAASPGKRNGHAHATAKASADDQPEPLLKSPIQPPEPFEED